MGRRKRTQPRKLKSKLKTIRLELGYTQDRMVKALHRYVPRESLDSGAISHFERGFREPSLPVLLAYSKLSGVSVNELIDDKVRTKG